MHNMVCPRARPTKIFAAAAKASATGGSGGAAATDAAGAGNPNAGAHAAANLAMQVRPPSVRAPR